MPLTEIFLTFCVSSFIGCVLGIVTFCYRSKCRECSFLGIKIVRDVEIEEKFDLEMIKNKNNVEVKDDN
jgi:hypothetical protein